MSEIPEMAKGQGVTLQRYKDGGLADAICFRMSEGSELDDGRRKRAHPDRE